MIAQPRIMELFRLDLDGGRLFWRMPPKAHARLLGAEAGSARKSQSGKSYWHVKIDGRAYKRAHLIFCAVYGRWPTPCCDHKDGNSLNDRPQNLREATVTENAWNHKGRARQSVLPMGVRALPSGNFQARIALNKQQIHLGSYSTPAEAQAVYAAKRKEFYGEFA